MTESQLAFNKQPRIWLRLWLDPPMQIPTNQIRRKGKCMKSLFHHVKSFGNISLRYWIVNAILISKWKQSKNRVFQTSQKQTAEDRQPYWLLYYIYFKVISEEGLLFVQTRETTASPCFSIARCILRAKASGSFCTFRKCLSLPLIPCSVI